MYIFNVKGGDLKLTVLLCLCKLKFLYHGRMI